MINNKGAHMRYFHGGAPGLKPGDIIEPRDPADTSHLVDDCPTCEARKAGQPLEGDNLDPGKIYVTTDREYAKLYAAGYGDGALYTVEPIGELEPSPDPVDSWGCDAARVLKVYDPLVRLTPKEIRKYQRQYGGR